MKLKLTVRPRISEVSKEALLALRGLTSLELIEKSVRRVICLQGPTVLCLDGGFLSLSH